MLRLELPVLHVQSGDVLRGEGIAGMRALEATTNESEVALRGGSMRCVARLRGCAGASGEGGAAVVPGGYAITGGLGGLGLRAAALLVEGGASRVLLASSRWWRGA